MDGLVTNSHLSHSFLKTMKRRTFNYVNHKIVTLNNAFMIFKTLLHSLSHFIFLPTFVSGGRDTCYFPNFMMRKPRIETSDLPRVTNRFFKKFLLLLNYSCLHFLLIPPPHPSQTHLPPSPPPSPLILSLCPL